MSETGSLDRMKSSAERRKKVGLYDTNTTILSGQVEGTRVNPDSLIDELLKDAKLDQLEESAECEYLFYELLPFFIFFYISLFKYPSISIFIISSHFSTRPSAIYSQRWYRIIR